MSKQTDWKAEWEKIQAESRKLAKRANQRLKRLEVAAERPGMSSILKYAYKTAVTDIKTLGKTEGKPRFKENVKLVDVFDKNEKLLTGQEMYKQNVKKQRTKIKMMKEFLESASSTIGQGMIEGTEKTLGIKKIWDKTTNTINKEILSDYDLRMSTNDMKRFFDSKKQAKLQELVGSSRMFIVASYIKKHNIKTNKRELEKFVRSNIQLEEGIDPKDIKARKGESYKDYVDRVVKQYVKYTNDETLNKYITKALKNGINVENIFDSES